MGSEQDLERIAASTNAIRIGVKRLQWFVLGALVAWSIGAVAVIPQYYVLAQAKATQDDINFQCGETLTEMDADLTVLEKGLGLSNPKRAEKIRQWKAKVEALKASNERR